MIYIGKKDTTAAREHLERALELQPAYVPAAANLAQLDLQEKNPRAARRRIEAILEKDKDNVQALLTLASLGPRIGATRKEQIDWLARFYAQAGTAERAYKLKPDSAAVADTLAGRAGQHHARARVAAKGGLRPRPTATRSASISRRLGSRPATSRRPAANSSGCWRPMRIFRSRPRRWRCLRT